MPSSGWARTRSCLRASARFLWNELIASAPEEILGKRDSARFEGKLPFLFKVLSAAVPLSIQAHPNEAPG